jgi:hypothetical protein
MEFSFLACAMEENFSRKLGREETIERCRPAWGIILKCILKNYDVRVCLNSGMV